MNSLKDDNVKLYVVSKDNDGFTQVDISLDTGIPESTINDFLNKKSYAKWWAENGGSVLCLTSEKPVSVAVKTSDTLPRPRINSIKSDVEPIIIQTSKVVKEFPTHIMIPDTQVKPDIDMSYLRWVGQYIAKKKPDVIIHIGDHFDLPSLSSYDRGTRKAEGNRLHFDIEAGILGMNILLEPIAQVQAAELMEFGEVKWKPKMVFTIGNHEERLMRHVNYNPELDGFVSYDDFKLEENGWEVYDFLEPAVVNGVTYCHFMANPMSGKPYGGAALNVLKQVGESFTMGHKQTLDIATRALPASGRQQWAIIAGSCYTHHEEYKGYQGNHHWRGIVVKHQVNDGDYNPMFIDLNWLEEKYGF